jgi:hypothetical protein
MSPFASRGTCSSALVAALTGGLVACGDGLVDASYQGLPLLSMAGQVMVEEELPPIESEVRVTILWSSQGGSGAQQLVSVTTDFPAQYTLNLYTPPPDEVLYQPAPVPDRAAIGIPLVYEDRDGSGRYDRGVDPVIGGAEEALVFWFPQDVEFQAPEQPVDTGHGFPVDTDDPPETEPAEPFEGALEAGYHVMQPLQELCQGGPIALTPLDPMQVDLSVGEVEEFLRDADCDGRTDEWGEI